VLPLFCDIVSFLFFCTELRMWAELTKRQSPRWKPPKL
jgi:hypothetical protein